MPRASAEGKSSQQPSKHGSTACVSAASNLTELAEISPGQALSPADLLQLQGAADAASQSGVTSCATYVSASEQPAETALDLEAISWQLQDAAIMQRHDLWLGAQLGQGSFSQVYQVHVAVRCCST